MSPLSLWKALLIASVATGCCAKQVHNLPWAKPDACSAKLLAWCSSLPDDESDLSQVICIDYTGNRPYRRPGSGTATDDSMLEPNRNVLVRVVRANPPDYEENVTISLGGAPGETIVKTTEGAGAVASSQSASLQSASRIPPLDDHCSAHEARFSPRMPGVLTVTVEIQRRREVSDAHSKVVDDNPDATKLVHKIKQTTPASPGAVPAVEDIVEIESDLLTKQSEKHAFELLVPQIYSGALRVGISQIWGAADHEYGTMKVGGTDMLAVTDEGPARWNTEVVAGYAPFFQAFGRQRGKDSFRLYKPISYMRLSPYIGLGLVGTSTTSSGTEVRWLRSFYLGFEYEVFSSMSIAFTAVWRRTDTLDTGLTVGGPTPDTSVTRTHLDGGVAIVFNFTPEFFRFAPTVGGPK